MLGSRCFSAPRQSKAPRCSSSSSPTATPKASRASVWSSPWGMPSCPRAKATPSRGPWRTSSAPNPTCCRPISRRRPQPGSGASFNWPVAPSRRAPLARRGSTGCSSTGWKQRTSCNSARNSSPWKPGESSASARCWKRPASTRARWRPRNSWWPTGSSSPPANGRSSTGPSAPPCPRCSACG